MGVDILKIDVDGYDGRVLHGAVKFLGKNSADGAPDKWHYDVMAIHRRNKVSPSSLATAQHARRKPSPF